MSATAKTQSLATQASAVKAGKRKPVFIDVPNIPRVPLADGRVGCVQYELLLTGAGETTTGAWMLTIPRKNADGSESGARFPLAEIQLIADAYRVAGHSLV